MHSRDFRKKHYHVPIACEGIPYLCAAMFTTLITAVLGWQVITVTLLCASLVMVHFFRDPERVMVAGDDDVVSPADGRVIEVRSLDSTRFIAGPCKRISIFMSIFDVHVNRVPVSGTIQGMFYQKGCFYAANLAKACEKNEQNWLWIRSDAGADIVITQVAGLIARRIVSWPTVGDSVIQGERFGMIRFGSRMDVYVPETCDVLVSRGQHVYAGETVLCRMK